MNTRERFRAVLNGNKVDRLPVFEWAPWWNKTVERWEQEGLPKGMNNHEIMNYFNLDLHYQGWLRTWTPECPKPVSHGAGLIENSAGYEKILPFLFPEADTVVDAEQWHSWGDIQRAGDAAVWLTLDGFFWLPRVFFGIENHLYAFYDEDELMHRINQQNAEWMIKVVDEICKYCTPDFMTFAEDMSYNHGPMISKDLFDEFMKPYYQIIIPHLKSKGIVPIVDSDGNVHDALGWFKEAGMSGILPLERQAGVDVKVMREDFPDMVLFGAFDKMVMNQGEAALRMEFERLMETAKSGRLLISCDHQTPPGVSLEDYKLYLKLFREYAARVN